jgi:hypothetical protein
MAHAAYAPTLNSSYFQYTRNSVYTLNITTALHFPSLMGRRPVTRPAPSVPVNLPSVYQKHRCSDKLLPRSSFCARAAWPSGASTVSLRHGQRQDTFCGLWTDADADASADGEARASRWPGRRRHLSASDSAAADWVPHCVGNEARTQRQCLDRVEQNAIDEGAGDMMVVGNMRSSSSMLDARIRRGSIVSSPMATPSDLSSLQSLAHSPRPSLREPLVSPTPRCLGTPSTCLIRTHERRR